jgi:ADP-glucose pyrophosphorylase
MRLSGKRNVIDCRAEICEGATLRRCVVLGNAALGADYNIEDTIVTALNDGRVHVTYAA